MSTYLQLCQTVARDSGTISSLTDPATVLNQTGRLLRIVNWVNDAWNEIQTEREDWRWMFGTFSGSTIANTANYTSATLGIAERFGQWRGLYEHTDEQWTCYKTSEGQSKEYGLRYVPYERFYPAYLTGTHDPGYPQHFTVAPDDSIYLGPTPDDVYTVRGHYQKSPQVLSADGDIPELPGLFHDVIKWKALILLGIFDEAFNQIPGWERKYDKLFSQLANEQVPRFEMPGPLA